MNLSNGIITGCGKGIGLACTDLFLSSSPESKLLGITRTASKDLEKLKVKYKERLHIEYADITDYAHVDGLIGEFITANEMPAFAVCNAGARSRVSIKDASLEKYREILEINTLAQINIVKILIDKKSNIDKKLNVLMLSSIVGQRGFSDLSTYGVSKAALEGFVKSAAIELAPDNISINSLNPGFVESSYAQSFEESLPELYQWTIKQTPMKRWGKCDEIAKIAMFLISPSNSYMTGSIVYCDGGWTSK